MGDFFISLLAEFEIRGVLCISRSLATGMAATWLMAYTQRCVMYLVSVTGILVTSTAWTGASASFAQTRSLSTVHRRATVPMIFLSRYYSSSCPRSLPR